MSDVDEGLQHFTGAPALFRHHFGRRLGATAVILCGLGAGSYAIAAAAPGHAVAAPKAASQALATSSSPSKAATPPTNLPALRPGGPDGFGPLGRGFGIGGAGLSAFGESGTITGVHATTITIESAFGASFTVSTNTSTTYSENGKTVSRSALASGERVMFLRAAPVGPDSSSALTSAPVRSVVIILPHVSGKVVSVNGSVVVVAQQDGLNVTVNTSNSTAYELAGQSAPAFELRAGTEVFVTGMLSSDHDQIDAMTIEIVLPSVAGRVTGVSGTTITIRSFGAKTETVTTGLSTVFTNASGKTTIASVAKGDLMVASGTPGSSDSFAAVAVRVSQVPSTVPALPGPPAPGTYGSGRFGPGGPLAGPGAFGGAAGWGAHNGAAVPAASAVAQATV